MRRLEVDLARDGQGGLVGTLTTDVDAPGRQLPYTVPELARERLELSPEQARQLAELWYFSETGDGKQLFPLVSVPREIFEKVVKVWIV